ncbi:hypothetical protein A9Q83_01240 [Alphaproteobacteria bacterium 46_93_T64]|nr:hypothetical protein A9Q83_01240 [Alphaproteobacteria bacterium 46_93_T64]
MPIGGRSLIVLRTRKLMQVRATMMATLQNSKLFGSTELKKGASKLVMGALLLTVAGCSTPDWVNPMNWFDDEEAGKPIETTGANEEYPKLGQVPDVAGQTVSIEEASSIQEGLKADRQNAQYTDDNLRAATTPQSMEAPKPPVVAAATGPAITPSPTQPVASTQLAQPGQAVSQFPTATQTSGGLKLMPNAAPVTTPQQAYATQVPGGSTIVISGTGVSDVYQQQLAASAATTTTLPANMQFQSLNVRPLGLSAVAVSQVVRDTYNQPVSLGYGAATGQQSTGGFSASGTPAAVIHFDTGSARLGAADVSKLKQIAQAQRQSGAMVKVVGHASSRTRQLPVDRHKLVNLRVSQERSGVVVNRLIKLGVAPSNIMVEALSDSIPVTRESMPSDEAKNRRTEIFLVK